MEESAKQKVKTNDNEPPCSLNLSVWKEKQSGRFQLRAQEEDGMETKIAVTEKLVQELDSASPWVDLFSRVGISSDDPPRVLIAELLGQKEVTLPPNGVAVLCRVHRFDAWRYYVSGKSLSADFFSDYVITKDDLQSDPDISAAITAG